MNPERPLPTRYRPQWLALFFLFALFLGLALWQVHRAWAAGYTVTTLADNTNDDGACSLREAILAANNNPANDDCGNGSADDDTITFAANLQGTIYLQSTLPPIVSAATAGKLTIDGGDKNNITISGDSNQDGTADVRHFFLNWGSYLILKNLTLTKGKTDATYKDGGSIRGYNADLEIYSCDFTDNQSEEDGGAIYLGASTGSNHQLIMEWTTFQNNAQTGATYMGGAVYASDMVVTITNVQFLNNQSQGGGGALILWGGRSTIQSTDFKDNKSKGVSTDGGGVVLRGGHQATISQSSFSGNQASNNGGALYIVDAQAEISDTTFDNNWAGYKGGGVYVWQSSTQARLTLQRCTLSNNQADFYGGGLYNWDATVTSDRSTFRENQADEGGAVYQDGGTLQIVNSTVAKSSDGGGIYADQGTLSAHSTTIAENHATASTLMPAGGIYNKQATVQLTHTIVANNTVDASHTLKNCAGTITDNNYNLADDNSCSFTQSHSHNNTDPKLGTLTGSPAYYPLQSDSPALDAGDNAACAAAPVNNQSQNGVTRPKDGDGDGQAVCDIGAYEAPEGGTPTPSPTLTPTFTSVPTATVTPSPTLTPTPSTVGQKPAGQLTASTTGWPLITWNMTWANIHNTQPLRILVWNLIPPNTTFVNGSLHCTGTGGTVVHTCTYNATLHRIEVEATLAADYGGTFGWIPAGVAVPGTLALIPPGSPPLPPTGRVWDLPLRASGQSWAQGMAMLRSPLTISYQTRAVPGATQIANQAISYWDENNDQQIDTNDPNVSHNTPVRTDDPSQSGSEDPTIARPPHLPETGFPAGRRSPRRPPTQPYAALGQVWIEIPRLGLRARIWGVPPSGEMDWLDEVGWLWGSAFPGHPGNSVLTAHNYLATGTPGPFVHLHTLHYGDLVRVHAYGTVYEFIVTQVAYVAPESKWPLRPVDDGHAWITLVTCAQWDEADQAYRYRVVVRGILVRWYQSGG